MVCASEKNPREAIALCGGQRQIRNNESQSPNMSDGPSTSVCAPCREQDYGKASSGRDEAELRVMTSRWAE